MAKIWDDFITFVAPYAPACPPVVIRDAVKEASEDLCRETNFWWADLPLLSVVAGVDTYEVYYDYETRISSILAVKFNGESIPIITPTDQDFYMSGWDPSDTGNAAISCRFEDDDDMQLLRLYPTPDSDISDILAVRVSLKPSYDAAGLPDWMFHDFRRVIASGALFRVCSMPGKDWTSPDIALFNKGLFEEGKAKAKSRLSSSNSSSILTVKPRDYNGYY